MINILFKKFDGPFKFNRLEVDVEKNIYKIDGEPINYATCLKIVITPTEVKVHVDRNVEMVLEAKKNIS